VLSYRCRVLPTLRRYVMKKVITLVVDEGVAKEILDDYYELADFVSIETEDEADLRDSGYDTWDNLDLDADDDEDYDEAEVCDECGNIDCDCDTRI
jgi:hypothetical protein